MTKARMPSRQEAGLYQLTSTFWAYTEVQTTNWLYPRICQEEALESNWKSTGGEKNTISSVGPVLWNHR